jgi:hypothetical protein
VSRPPTQGPKSAASLGYSDTELEGQYRIPDGHNVMKMPDGRMWSTSSRASADPDYKVPVMRIVIGDNAPDDSRIPTQMRPLPPLPSNWKNMLDNRLIFEVKRGSGDLLLALRRCGVGGWAPGGRAEVRQVAERGSPGARRQMTPRCCRYRKAAIPGSTGSQ